MNPGKRRDVPGEEVRVVGVVAEQAADADVRGAGGQAVLAPAADIGGDGDAGERTEGTGNTFFFLSHFLNFFFEVSFQLD